MNGDPTAVPGDALNELLEKTPLELFAVACGISIALILFLIWLTFFRPLRAKSKTRRREDGSAESGSESPPDISDIAVPPGLATTPSSGSRDMPELDLLLDTSVLAKEVPQAESPAPQPSSVAVPSLPAKSAPIREHVRQVELHTGILVAAEEILAILRDPRDGRLIVQIGGVGYRTLMDTPDVKKEFISVMKKLSDVVTKPDASSPPIRELKPEVPQQRGTTAPPPVTKPARQPPVPPEPVVAGYRLEDNLIPPDKRATASIPQLDLASAIEIYLQHKLRSWPEYTQRNIHVRSAPGGGVTIQVDTNFYDAVSDVEDEQVREFLMVTIQEWQERQ